VLEVAEEVLTKLPIEQPAVALLQNVALTKDFKLLEIPLERSTDRTMNEQEKAWASEIVLSHGGWLPAADNIRTKDNAREAQEAFLFRLKNNTTPETLILLQGKLRWLEELTPEEFRKFVLQNPER
jgi:hypothetical protein